MEKWLTLFSSFWAIKIVFLCHFANFGKFVIVSFTNFGQFMHFSKFIGKQEYIVTLTREVSFELEIYCITRDDKAVTVKKLVKLIIFSENLKNLLKTTISGYALFINMSQKDLFWVTSSVVL